MKLKEIFVLASMFALPLVGTAQDNLVDNGGFESTTGKIKKPGQIDLATGWKSPTAVRADVYLKDSKVKEISTTENAYGKEAPAEGENYGGIVMYSPKGKMPRSYLMTKLKTPLKKDVKYCVSFKLSLAEGSKYACNNIGVMFDKKERGSDTKGSIVEDKTSVLSSNNKIYNAMFGWETVCNTYTAEGGEKFIVIGNFGSDDPAKIKTEAVKKAKDNKFAIFAGAYYYIDDIVVTILEDGQKCACNTADEAVNDFSTTIYQKPAIVTDKMTSAQKIEVQQLYFAFGKDVLTKESNTALDLIVTEMKANPSSKITVISHNDTGEDALSEKKAYYANMDDKRFESVKAYLISKGIDKSRIMTEGKGASENNDKEIKAEDLEDLKMAKNRRVVFKVS